MKGRIWGYGRTVIAFYATGAFASSEVANELSFKDLGGNNFIFNFY